MILSSPRVPAPRAVTRGLVCLSLVALGACQTAPVPPSGFLSSYEGGSEPRSLRAAIQHRRDETAVGAVTAVYLQPSILTQEAGAELDQGERDVVLRELDRHVCYRLSRYFKIAEIPGQDTATVRTAVIRIRPTGRIASAASAVGGYFIPVPMVNLRVPTTTGGLAIESEMLGADGSQIGRVSYARNANVIGLDAPSLSRVGDAMVMTEAAAAALVRAYAPEGRRKASIGDPDPCAAYGPRRNGPRWIASRAFGALTGLQAPELTGTARPAPERSPPPAAESNP